MGLLRPGRASADALHASPRVTASLAPGLGLVCFPGKSVKAPPPPPPL